MTIATLGGVAILIAWMLTAKIEDDSPLYVVLLVLALWSLGFLMLIVGLTLT